MKSNKRPANNSNLVAAMKELFTNKDHDKSLIKKWKLPNVRAFEIEINSWDELFAYFGIKKRLAPLMTYEKYQNGSMNRYLQHQLLRLIKYRNEPMIYWTIAFYLLRRSLTFRVLAVNHVYPQWQRKENYYTIKGWLRKVENIAKDMDDKLVYHRVYIPKNEETWRPLGVPSPAWRIWLHMWNQVLSVYMQERMPKCQHGFMPGRGTLTAWVDILNKVEKYPDIWEFDLSKFFDCVSLKWNQRFMHNLVQIPKGIAAYLTRVNLSKIELPNIDKWKLDETAAYMKQRLHEGTMGDDSNDLCWYGVPQGAPTSPLLSLINLIPNLLRENIVMYADDGIMFGGPEGKDINIYPYTKAYQNYDDTLKLLGITFNEKKCHHIKRDGIWLKELKFLGLSYNGWTKELRASTKKGSKLLMDKHQLILWDRLRTQEGMSLKDLKQSAGEMTVNKWEEFVNSKLRGFFMSRLYIGEYNIKEFMQDFEFNYIKKSWVGERAHKVKMDLNIFNSSSAAVAALANSLKYERQRNERARR